MHQLAVSIDTINCHLQNSKNHTNNNMVVDPKYVDLQMFVEYPY